MPIVYLHGDATSPAGPGPRIIVHVCNDIGAWGKGFVLSRRWPAVEAVYRRWHEAGGESDGRVRRLAAACYSDWPLQWTVEARFVSSLSRFLVGGCAMPSSTGQAAGPAR